MHTGKVTAKNKVLQRIYGVCFPTAEELEAHLKLLEEAKERDHRKIGKDMNLFMVDDLVGRGLPMFFRRGWGAGELYQEQGKKAGLSACYDSLCRYRKSVQDIRSLGSLKRKHVPTNGDGGRVLRSSSDELPASYDDLCKQKTFL